jgi:hypothetical protein
VDRGLTKLEHYLNGEWLPYSQPPVFSTETLADGSERLLAGVPGGDSGVIEALLGEPPYLVLYVLHTSRGEGPIGRYQSPELDKSAAAGLLTSYRDFLAQDGRFDLWVHSVPEQSTLVWDRHDLLFAYGPLERFRALLSGLCFTDGKPSIPSPHSHVYRPAYDGAAARLLSAFAWTYSALQPEDEQFADQQ